MKSVLISIQPKWVEKIVSGEKTIEIRKTRPKIETPFKCYIYCTKDKYAVSIVGADKPIIWHGKVIGEFVCDRVDEYKFNWAEFTAYANRTYLISEKQLKNTCLSREEFNAYGCGENVHKEKLYGWHISNLKIYDKPKELSEFKKHCHSVGVCYKCEDNVYWGGKCDGGCIERPPQSWCYVKEQENER